MPKKIMLVAGARPNFMKIAPLMWEIQQRNEVDAFLVHTGQHYDERMSQRFFEELDIPAPDVNLEVGSGSHAQQTAEVMKRFEPVLTSQRPDLLLVVGDVNSTLACALVASKLRVPVAHVEAGLRSFDRAMPEEINRVLTDAVSDWLFVTEPSGLANLRAENVPAERTFLVGNVMIDSLVASLPRIESSPILDDLKLAERKYAVLTMHRPSNVDQPMVLERLVGAILRVARDIPLVFPVHPRARRNLEQTHPELIERVRCVDPLGYFDFMQLVRQARFVLTDSGGVQEETTYLGVPCLTMRENTERPVTVAQGSNRLVGVDPDRIVSEALSVLAHTSPRRQVPDLWDGKAAGRILDVLQGRTAATMQRALAQR